MTIATSKAPRKRTMPRPADTCRLTVTIHGVAYTARPVRPETSVSTRRRPSLTTVGPESRQARYRSSACGQDSPHRLPADPLPPRDLRAAHPLTLKPEDLGGLQRRRPRSP